MMLHRRILITHLVLISLVLDLAGCALFGGGQEGPTKNPSIHFSTPDAPFSRIHVTSADAVWQSDVTGSTIAVNSSCTPNEERSLEGLQHSLFSGIEHLQMDEQKEMVTDGLPSLRTLAKGWYDGSRVSIDSIVIKKKDCTYDLIYITAPQDFEKEHSIFQRFARDFKVP